MVIGMFLFVMFLSGVLAVLLASTILFLITHALPPRFH